jgi:hypothetical protein
MPTRRTPSAADGLARAVSGAAAVEAAAGGVLVVVASALSSSEPQATRTAKVARQASVSAVRDTPGGSHAARDR